MARKPELTVGELEGILGPRGHLHVGSDNRHTARKWCSAFASLPSMFCAGLSNTEMALAYNQTDGAGILKIKQKYAKYVASENGNDNPKIDGDLDVEPDAQIALNNAIDQGKLNVPPVPAPANAHDATAIGILRDLLLNGYKPGIDENAVRAIVQDAIAGVAPRVIEVKHPNKDAIRIEGLVHPEYERALGYLQQGLNVMLVGPAGCGKSHMIGQLAKGLDVDHTIIGGTAGATEGDIVGKLLPTEGGAFHYFPSLFVTLYENGKALLGFDEIDGFDPNTLMVANMPLANGHMYVHLRSVEKLNPRIKRGDDVHFIATANTYGTGSNPVYAGRNPMDEATRDRFIFISVDYDKRLEESIAAAGGLNAAEMAGIWELRDRCREAQLRRVISTRAFQKAAGMKACGDSWREIRDRLLEGWSKDEKAKVGV